MCKIHLIVLLEILNVALCAGEPNDAGFFRSQLLHAVTCCLHVVVRTVFGLPGVFLVVDEVSSNHPCFSLDPFFNQTASV